MRSTWTPREIELLRYAYKKYGTKWERIYYWYFPEREVNQIKNRWYKLLRHEQNVQNSIEEMLYLLREQTQNNASNVSHD